MLTVPLTRGSSTKILAGNFAHHLDHAFDVGVDKVQGHEIRFGLARGRGGARLRLGGRFGGKRLACTRQERYAHKSGLYPATLHISIRGRTIGKRWLFHITRAGGRHLTRASAGCPTRGRGRCRSDAPLRPGERFTHPATLQDDVIRMDFGKPDSRADFLALGHRQNPLRLELHNRVAEPVCARRPRRRAAGSRFPSARQSSARGAPCRTGPRRTPGCRFVPVRPAPAVRHAGQTTPRSSTRAPRSKAPDPPA